MRRAAGYDGGSTHPDRNFIQEENEQMTDELRSKVTALKSLSIEMGAEVRDQNAFINDTSDFFTKGQSLLESSMKRISKIASGGQNKHLLWLFLFCLFVFVVIYFIVRWR
ncbi:BET1 homolog [Antedon mediterranea]|uniref:BET1 homolog n=1 Tax=Antedon mediterranea TaxID=105859 RepID=UPI003AF78242